ncbi:MAG: SsrA-binding protein SmpB [Deltaproteobacteria bacterium]|nr:MAG: SsrA-binding protein SmpB [Deltaproteobacteria bacterium]
MGEKIVCRNKKARFNYTIEETIEAGIVLLGTEVKSLRQGKANITDSYARFRNGEVFLIGAHISPYDFGTHENHDPLRERKLLLHRREIRRLLTKVTQRGYTLVPLEIYFKDGHAKVLLALGKGKKLYDKRETMRKREEKREIDRAVKQRYR